jgi:peptide deformylase
VAVVDVRGIEDRPSTLFLGGAPVAVESFMPLVLINPEVSPVGEPVEGPEGCLSFPEIFAPVRRPESVEVKALGADGRPQAFRCGGLLARAVQHEVDHLNGILFIDRMDRKSKEAIRDDLDALQAETKARLAGKRR